MPTGTTAFPSGKEQRRGRVIHRVIHSDIHRQNLSFSTCVRPAQGTAGSLRVITGPRRATTGHVPSHVSRQWGVHLGARQAVIFGTNDVQHSARSRGPLAWWATIHPACKDDTKAYTVPIIMFLTGRPTCSSFPWSAGVEDINAAPMSWLQAARRATQRGGEQQSSTEPHYGVQMDVPAPGGSTSRAPLVDPRAAVLRRDAAGSSNRSS
jgi:hypothetical protein